MKTLPDEIQKIPSSIFQKQLDASKLVTGNSNTFVLPDLGSLMKVVPIPSIALQWLINSNGWPLGCMTSCTGEQRTFKSAFSYQLAVRFLKHGGFVQLIDATKKLPNKLLHDMIGKEDLREEYAESARLQISRINTMEECRSILEKADELRRESYPKPVTMEFPWLSAIDLPISAVPPLKVMRNNHHAAHANGLPGWAVPHVSHTSHVASCWTGGNRPGYIWVVFRNRSLGLVQIWYKNQLTNASLDQAILTHKPLMM